MLPQLLLVKRLFLASGNYPAREDPVAAGMAISLLQDSVELYVWTLIKERNVQVKAQSGFIANLEALQKAEIGMPFAAKLHELNRARVNFKHYGNLPDPSEVAKHRLYAEEVLRNAMQDHFRIDFDDLSLLNLVSDPAIRDLMRIAEGQIKAGALEDSAASLAQARTLVFGLAKKYLPLVDGHLRDADRVLNRVEGVRGVKTFAYLSSYFEVLREATLAAMFQIPVEDIAFLRAALPSAYQSLAGTWQYSHARLNYTDAECRRAMAVIVSLCLSLQGKA